MKLIPARGKCVVVREEAEGKTPGGIILPDVAKEKPVIGKILACGQPDMNSDGMLAPEDFKEGDRVVFTSYSRNKIELERQEYLILAFEDILAVIK